MIDLTKLSPSPWYFVTPTGSELETLVFLEHDEDVPVLTPGVVGDEACDQNWDFIAVARDAFDVMMRRGWEVYKMRNRRWGVSYSMQEVGSFRQWLATDPKAMADDPFTALVEADKWYRENVENINAG